MSLTKRTLPRTFAQAFRRVFSIGKRFTPTAEQLRSHLIELEPASLTDGERAEIGDLMVAWQSANAAERVVNLGGSISSWGNRGAPRQAALPTRPRWAEHRFSLSFAGEPALYVAEPYTLAPEDLQDLVDLVADGWSVTVSGASLHSPGRTLRVSLLRAANATQAVDADEGGRPMSAPAPETPSDTLENATASPLVKRSPVGEAEPLPHGPPWIRTSEAAQRLGVSRRAVLRLIESGVLPAKQYAPGAWRLVSAAATARLAGSVGTLALESGEANIGS